MNEDKNTLTFGNVIKLIRAQRNLTMRQFSEIVGISPTHICDLENENRRGNLEIVTKISKKITLSQDEHELLMNAFFLNNLTLPQDLIYYLINNDLMESFKDLMEYDKNGKHIKILASNLKQKN